jgi:hypothetical protein
MTRVASIPATDITAARRKVEAARVLFPEATLQLGGSNWEFSDGTPLFCADQFHLVSVGRKYFTVYDTLQERRYSVRATKHATGTAAKIEVIQ